MRNYLLAILFIILGDKIAGCAVSSSPCELIKFSLQIQEEKAEEKIHHFNCENHETELHADAICPLIHFEIYSKQHSITHSDRESGFADRPFTPPDVI